jgi:hypothetical protein
MTCHSSEWRFATVSFPFPPDAGYATLTSPCTDDQHYDNAMTVRSVSDEWEHLKPAIEVPGAVVLFRTHSYNSSGNNDRVEVHLASAILGADAFSELERGGSILSKPVPTLKVTTIELPSVVDKWPKRLLRATTYLAAGVLPAPVQQALGKGVSLHGYDNKLEITGYIKDKRLFRITFSIKNTNKAGFLGWASGKTGTLKLVEDDDELWYSREFFRPLFVFMDKKADELEQLARQNHDNDLKKAVRLFCGDSQNRQENIRTGSMTMFLVNIRKFVELFQYLGHYRVPRGLVQTNMQTKIEQGLATLWSHQGIDPNVYGRRKQCLAAITKQLLRSAQKGPDVPLHIVFDGPNSCVPHCVLVPVILDEVVIRTADVLCLLFGTGDMPRYSTITNSFDVMSELDERQNHF